MQDNELGPLKDEESRVVPLQDALLPILKAWKVETSGSGLLFPPTQRSGGRKGRPPRFMRPHALHAHLRAALVACDLPATLTWYQCTRQTFASQWVMADGSIEKLAAVLGHSSTEVTRRYAHLRPEHFRDADRRLLAVDLTPRERAVVPLPRSGALGHEMATQHSKAKAARSGIG